MLVNESWDSVHQIVSLSYDPIVGLVSAQLYPRSVRPVLRSSLCNLSEFNDQVLGQRFQLLAWVSLGKIPKYVATNRTLDKNELPQEISLCLGVNWKIIHSASWHQTLNVASWTIFRVCILDLQIKISTINTAVFPVSMSHIRKHFRIDPKFEVMYYLDFSDAQKFWFWIRIRYHCWPFWQEKAHLRERLIINYY